MYLKLNDKIRGGDVKLLIKVISSYLIYSKALLASSNRGKTFLKSSSQEDFNPSASDLAILVCF